MRRVRHLQGASMSIELARLELKQPDDLSAFEETLRGWGPGRLRRLGLFFRVPGEYEDGSREKAHAAVAQLLQRYGLATKAEMVTVVGCEGATTPCAFVFADLPDENASGNSSAGEPRLAIGLAHGRAPADAELDQAAFALKVADLARTAIADGAMTSADIATIFVNTPFPIRGDKGARSRRARAVAALGSGIALGEIDPAQVTEAKIANDPALHTRRVQTFTGPTVKQVEVIALGNRRDAGGRLIAHAAVTNDLLDVRPLKRLLLGAGLHFDQDGELSEPQRVVAALIKSGARSDGRVLNYPTGIFGGVIPPEKQVRAVQSGVFGAILQTTCMFNTFDTIQQAPEGGAQICCVIST